MDLVCERHDYYRERMAEAGLRRSSFTSVADLNKLPLTLKADYMDTRALCARHGWPES